MAIVKRDGRQEPFSSAKIVAAVERCLLALSHPSHNASAVAQRIADSVTNIISTTEDSLSVERIQDLVEQQLMAYAHFAEAKSYILYREEHRKQRERAQVDPEESQYINDSLAMFGTDLQRVQYLDKYARWNAKAGRRETWPETVSRVIGFFNKQLANRQLELSVEDWAALKESMLNLEAMPSMRVLQMAGPALERCNVGAYNCSYIPIDSLDSFTELLYVLMQGTGVGFSVESRYVEELPRIRRQKKNIERALHIVQDSTEGWCDALHIGLAKWVGGEDVEFDFSQIRAQGTLLKTKGGRASGPGPLKQLLAFARSRILARQGRWLSTLDAHDIACVCGSIVQVGGVRRAALISLSDLDDREMRAAKLGQFWNTDPHRAMANNSAVYESRPESVVLLEEWLSLAKSGTGERGIFNREGLKKQAPKRRKKDDYGVNPCGEISLRPRQFCNLSIAVARADDTPDTLTRKVGVAALFGTIQSLLTDFKYLRPEWKQNCEEERLLGVDITGQMDCPLLRPDAQGREALLAQLREHAVNTNKHYAGLFAVPASAAVTCVKPSGNSSTLFNCSSGLHPRYAPYYIRRIRMGTYTPIAKMLIDEGVPHSQDNDAVMVFEFPVKSPDGAITRNDMTALEQLENWLVIKRNFTEHNPSITVYVGDREWVAVLDWVQRNWDFVGGISFLPRDGGVYQLAPYEEISKAQYDALVAAMPQIDYAKLLRYEREDYTEGAQELACVSGACEI